MKTRKQKLLSEVTYKDVETRLGINIPEQSDEKRGTSDHTPTPFVSQTPWNIETDINNGDHLIVEANGTAICRCLDLNDAKDIVRAVNSHDELVEALNAIQARINGEFDNPALVKFGALGNTLDDIVQIAVQAIAKAAGK